MTVSDNGVAKIRAEFTKSVLALCPGAEFGQPNVGLNNINTA